MIWPRLLTSANYVAFCTYGKPSEMGWPARRLAFTPNLSVQLKDQRVHTARILSQPPVLSVFLDDSSAPVLKSVVDLSIVVDRQGGAWVGFTASTGGGYENHDILNWHFRGTDVASSMDSRVLYVSNRGEGSVSVIDFATRNVIRKWQVPGTASPDMGGVR
jgi:YVTN family beta-propeller protein